MHVFSDPNAFNKLPSNSSDYVNENFNKLPDFPRGAITSDLTISDGEDGDTKEALHPIDQLIEDADVCVGCGDFKGAKEITKSALEQATSLESDDEQTRYLLAYAQMAHARILMLAHEDIIFAWELADKAVRSPELKTKK